MKFDAFLAYVLPSVVGCPQSLAVAHVVRAARRFCEKTHVWNFQAAPFDSASGVATYTLPLDAGMELVRLYGVTVDDREYRVASPIAGRRAAREDCGGDLVTLTGNQDFVLTPAPWADSLPIVVDLAVMPTLDASTWPDDFAAYVEDVAHGAIWSLCSIPKQDWTDADTAGRSLALFHDRIATVGYVVSKGRGRDRENGRIEFF